jgi:hypothetical protein
LWLPAELPFYERQHVFHTIHHAVRQATACRMAVMPKPLRSSIVVVGKMQYASSRNINQNQKDIHEKKKKEMSQR